MARVHVAIIYNSCNDDEPDPPDDRSGTQDQRQMIRTMARVLRRVGYRVTVVPLAQNLTAFQRQLRRLKPDVVFNQYEDVIDGAIYDMRVGALVQMMGFPMTGAPALALGLTRYKFMTSSLLQGAGVRVPPDTVLVEHVGDIDRHTWRFPVIVQPSREDGGSGLDRRSVVKTPDDLRRRVRAILREYRQPALAQAFLPGREFNVSVIGGRRLTVLPLAEVDYSQLPAHIPPIMSYAAKWLEGSVEYENTSVICPARVSPALAQEISSTALRAFRAVGVWGYGRVDMRLDAAGHPCVLEVNCNPSIEEEVALARSAKQAGIDYPELLDRIVRIALEGPPMEVGITMR